MAGHCVPGKNCFNYTSLYERSDLGFLLRSLLECWSSMPHSLRISSPVPSQHLSDGRLVGCEGHCLAIFSRPEVQKLFDGRQNEPTVNGSALNTTRETGDKVQVAHPVITGPWLPAANQYQLCWRLSPLDGDVELK